MGRNNVSVQHSQQIRCLYQVCGVSGRKLLQMFPQYCKAVISNHAKRPISEKMRLINVNYTCYSIILIDEINSLKMCFSKCNLKKFTDSSPFY